MPSNKNISEKQKEKKKTYKKNTFKNVDPCHQSVFVIYFEQAIAYWDTQKQKDLQKLMMAVDLYLKFRTESMKKAHK